MNERMTLSELGSEAADDECWLATSNVTTRPSCGVHRRHSHNLWEYAEGYLGPARPTMRTTSYSEPL